MMIEDRFLKRLRKKAKKGMRGWPAATIAFYGPNLNQATKVAVGIVPSENADVAEMRDWQVEHGDVRNDPGIAEEIPDFMAAGRAVGRDDRRHHRVPAPGGDRLRRRMVPGLRFLARPGPVHRADTQLSGATSALMRESDPQHGQNSNTRGLAVFHGRLIASSASNAESLSIRS